MTAQISMSAEFQQKVLSLCADDADKTASLKGAFEAGELREVDDFLVLGAAQDLPVFGIDMSATDVLVRLDEGDVDGLIKDVQAFSDFLLTEEGAEFDLDFRLRGRPAEMVDALRLSKTDDSALDHLRSYLKEMSDLEQKRDLHAELREAGYVYGS